MPVGKTVHDLEREYYLSQLGLSVSQAANMTLTDLRVAFYTNPPAGGGGGGLDLTNSTGTLNADKIVAGSTNAPLTINEKTKLSGVATGATANSTDAVLKDRANHTGTMSADNLTTGSTNAPMTVAEKTKLSGVATGATANSSDATLLARTNHTGTQVSTTISDLTNVTKDTIGGMMQDGVGIDYTYNSGTKVLSSAATGSEGYKIFWNATSNTWPARPTPDGIHFYDFISTNEAGATIPSDIVLGDNWTRHPDDVT